MQLFADLLHASGASLTMIKEAMACATRGEFQGPPSTTFTDLGSILRDCMEVMCTWRRDVDLVDDRGEPAALVLESPDSSFATLCRKARCRRHPAEILEALVEFGAVSVDQ